MKADGRRRAPGPAIVGENNNNAKASSLAAGAPHPARRRSPLPLVILAAIFIIVPFLTWYGTWFGRKLTDDKISEYLVDQHKPRHVQHALAQIEERMAGGDTSVKQWYPQIVGLSGDPVPEFRKMAAYLMGYDNGVAEFRTALANLLNDQEPLVRRQAALSLVTFNDSRGLPEVRAMLQPYVIRAPGDGTIGSVVGEGVMIREGTLLARIVGEGAGASREVRAPLPGRISSVTVSGDALVAAGDPLFTITPDGQLVWEALRALHRIGEREDLPEIERYAQGVDGMPENIKEQAAQTLEAVRSRFAENRD